MTTKERIILLLKAAELRLEQVDAETETSDLIREKALEDVREARRLVEGFPNDAHCD